jgi:hypothetical protein
LEVKMKMVYGMSEVMKLDKSFENEIREGAMHG